MTLRKSLGLKTLILLNLIPKPMLWTSESMDALMNATDKPLIIINESMQFSAGVNLNYVMEFVNKRDMKSVEKFIKYFSKTCKHLKYCKNPVISALQV